MSEYLWVVPVGLIVSLLLVFAFFGYFRIKRPYSKKKAEEQDKLDKKQGASSGTAPAPQTIEKKSDGDKGIKWSFIVAGVIVALLLLAVWLWPFTPGKWSPTPKDVWEFMRDYWFWTITILAILFFGLSVSAKPWAKAVQGMVGVVAITLVGALVVHGIWGEKTPSQQVQQRCLPYSSTEVRQCMMTGEATIVTADQLTYEGEFEFCAVVPKNSPFRIEQIRTNTLKMWSTDGTVFPAQYKMIRPNELVNGKCPSKF